MCFCIRTCFALDCFLVAPSALWQPSAMSTLAEIESAADSLPPEEKEELFLFLAARLRAASAAELPAPRKFSREQIETWIRDDEAGMARFREGQ